MKTNPVTDKDKKNKKQLFDRDEFKKGVAFVESNNGKFLWNNTSSATGKYQFLYNEIKHLPLLKGVTREQFRDNPELQEKIMDMAIDNNLKGRPGYFKNAIDLTNEFKDSYGSKWNYRADEVALLSHFLGRQGARNYLKAQLSGNEFKVPGQNLKVTDYLDRYNQAIDKKRGIEIQSKSQDFEDSKLNNILKQEELNLGIQDSTSPNQFKIPAINPLFTNKAPSYQQPVDENTVKQKIKRPEPNISSPSQVQWIENYLNSNEFQLGGPMMSNNDEKELISYDSGGSHETNPYGGIPQGIGKNGKMNTVEEGETSFELKNGKFIFSDRLGFYDKSIEKAPSNSFQNGGDIDPPKDKDWYNKWINSDEYKKRLDSTNELYHRGKVPTDKLLDLSNRKLESVKINNQEFNENILGEYFPSDHKIDINIPKNDVEYNPTMAHELTHSTQKLQDFNDKVIDKIASKRNFNDYLKTFDYELTDDELAKEKRYYDYINRDGMYPRIMELRNKFNIKPGEKINKDKLKNYKSFDSDLFRLYSDEDMVKILNTVASNNKPTSIDDIIIT